GSIEMPRDLLPEVVPVGGARNERGEEIADGGALRQHRPDRARLVSGWRVPEPPLEVPGDEEPLLSVPSLPGRDPVVLRPVLVLGPQLEDQIRGEVLDI